MKIAVIGTGMVGRALAERLDGLGHDVVIGTRDAADTLARTEPDPVLGTAPYRDWQPAHPGVRLVSFTEAGQHAEVVFNATNGVNSISALEAVGAENLAGKVLADVALSLDLSDGMPPKLGVANTDSLGEQIQRTFPEAKVVKTLNTMAFHIMVDPSLIPGYHNVFVAGDDPEAKATVTRLLGEFGWPTDDVIDLGDITGARGAEMYSRLLFTVSEVLGSYDFNLAIVRAGN